MADSNQSAVSDAEAVTAAVAGTNLNGSAPPADGAAAAPPKLVNGMTIDERVKLMLTVGVCETEEGLRKLLEKKPGRPVCYDGFEPSGRMHIAQGILKAINVNKLTEAGCSFKFWIADWFAQLNKKMGGDMKKIRVVGEYFVEIWKACGMKMEHVEFINASDEINSRPDEYWTRVMDIAGKNSLARIMRCGTIMGRGEGYELSAAQVMYPCMQCADIFFLKADICQLGMDQRKVNMLAREYCDQAKPKIKNKPIILSHAMMPGLKQGQEKMSKSDPNSAIFMEDAVSAVNSKIKGAFCPEMVVEDNPVLVYVKTIILPLRPVHVKRSEENGGDIDYTDYDTLESDFKEGKLHPGDLKPAVAKAINEILQPIRDHFKNNPHAKKLLKQVQSYKVTK